MATGSFLETDRDYPTSDGKPMAETELHRKVMVDLIDVLQHRYRDRPDVYVSGDLLMFYEPGETKKHVAPDVFVVFGVRNHMRDNYLLWREGKGPDFIVEVTSKTTRKVDQTKKRVLYRNVMKVPEYFQFDPRAEYLRPSLQGFRRVAGEYVPLVLEDDGLTSEVLGVRLVREDRSLRLFDIETGERLLTSAERAAHEAERAAHEAERAALETEARLAADKRAESAKERLRRLQAEHDQVLAELERLKRP